MNDGRLIDFAKRLLASEDQNCDPVIKMNYQEFEAKRLLSDDDVPWRTLNDARKSIENVAKRMTVNEDDNDCNKNILRYSGERTKEINMNFDYSEKVLGSHKYIKRVYG